ncbi:MAG: HIT family protein [Actinomycetota bacterium]|nr:HIT family protein [Actinomycetota bacterium]
MDEKSCPFCSPETRSRAVAEKGTVFAMEDSSPVTEGHHLVIPFRHTPEFFTMTGRERRDALELVALLRDRIAASDPSVKAFNLGVNCGEEAGQTVMHAHIHLIPRRKGDTPDPRGGVRGVIPGRMSY